MPSREQIPAGDISRLGEPLLFWGVTGGCIDSMVANRTASGKKRKSDDYTPAGMNNRRPDRAVLVYANLIRTHFKDTVPIVLGGIEASLRRVAHYDFWSDKVRRSILFDAKADYLLYGMAERSVLELAEALRQGAIPGRSGGSVMLPGRWPTDCLELPSFEACGQGQGRFTRMFHLFYRNNDPVTARTACPAAGQPLPGSESAAASPVDRRNWIRSMTWHMNGMLIPLPAAG